MVSIRHIAILYACLFALAGCGGDGGSNPKTGGSPSVGGSSGLALGSGSGADFTEGELTFSPANIVFNGTTTVTVNIVDATNANTLSLNSVVVTFTSTCASLETPTATITTTVTTSNGSASATYVASGCAGSDTITASIVDTNPASGIISIGGLSLGTGMADSFLDGTLDITTSNLSFGGSTGVSVNIVDSNTGELYTANSVDVNFSTQCSLQVPAKASIDAVVSTQTGVATATYNASGCVGSDTITASLGGVLAIAVVSIAKQDIGAIRFVSTDPNNISLAGIGSETRPSSSNVIFEVVDTSGEAISGQEVAFKLSSEVGGASLSLYTGVTDSDGRVSTTLNAGTVNSTTRVIATLNVDGQEIETASNPIAMHSGLPDQDSFSLSASVLNPAAWDHDGVESEINIRVADEFNNPVPDGTSVSFMTSGGSVEGSCEVADGVCSVVWESQAPRPTAGGTIVGLTQTGLVRILATSTGQESYTDSNSDGRYDIGEVITTPLTTEAFLDANFSSAYELGEKFSDFNFSTDPNYVKQFDTNDGTIFNGPSCSEEALSAGHCASLVDVRASLTLCMSTDRVLVSLPSIPVVDDVNDVPFVVTLTDAHGIMPAIGTSISFSASGNITGSGSFDVPNTCGVGGVSVGFSIRRNDTYSDTAISRIEYTLNRADGVTETFTSVVNVSAF